MGALPSQALRDLLLVEVRASGGSRCLRPDKYYHQLLEPMHSTLEMGQ